MATLFVDNLTVIDFSYACATRGIVGASWIVDIELGGALNEQGMVFDFGHVKKAIKQLIDDTFDHKLWLNQSLPRFTTVQTGQRISAEWQNHGGDYFRHASPSSAVLLLDQAEISPTAQEALVASAVKAILPNNVHTVKVRLREEKIDGAAYCYTHGLQNHDGNCQRIAHGHRSRIKIYTGAERDTRLEEHWATEWQDIYLATRSHVVQQTDRQIELAYEAEQGWFELSLPAKHVYVTDIVTTVENIAEYLARATAEKTTARPVEVRAYEGIAKGALARVS